MKYLAIILIGVIGIVNAQVSDFSGKNQNKVFKKLILSDKEQELLEMSMELCEESKLNIKEAKAIEQEIKELKEIMEVSKNFKDIHDKAKKKAIKYTSYTLSLRMEAAECEEMRNSIIYAIMESHYKDIDDKHKADSEIDQLMTEARSLFEKAKQARERSFDAYDDFSSYEKLCEANKLGKQALLKQQELYADVFDIKLDSKKVPDFGEMVADKTENENKDRIAEDILMLQKTGTLNENTSDKAIENVESSAGNSDFAENTKTTIDVTSKTKSNFCIYRIQVGAFVNEIDDHVFMGLSPLTKDDNDETKYTKYMVGEYGSYKAACKARKLISETLGYSDAFVVAYQDDTRIKITEEMKEDIKDLGSGLNMAVK